MRHTHEDIDKHGDRRVCRSVALMSNRDTSGNLLWSNIPGLSTLELQFETRQKLDDSSTITVGAPALADMKLELLCPICLDVMENVMVAKCLHRYCKDCIDKHLRQVDQKRECPLCRVHLATNRSLRKDDAMDAIVNLLYYRKDKKRHRDGDDFRPEVSVVRDGAKRHREQVSMMREKQRIRKLSMEALQRTKALEDSILKRDERRDQPQLPVPTASIVPNNGTQILLPLPFPSGSTTASALNAFTAASISQITNDSMDVLIANSTTATTTTVTVAATTAAATNGSMDDNHITSNLNSETRDDTSTVMSMNTSTVTDINTSTEMNMDINIINIEKIEWAEMKTNEELETYHEESKNVPYTVPDTACDVTLSLKHSGSQNLNSLNNEKNSIIFTTEYDEEKVNCDNNDNNCNGNHTNDNDDNNGSNRKEMNLNNSSSNSSSVLIDTKERSQSSSLITSINPSNIMTDINHSKDNGNNTNNSNLIAVVPVSTVYSGFLSYEYLKENSNNISYDKNNNISVTNEMCVSTATTTERANGSNKVEIKTNTTDNHHQNDQIFHTNSDDSHVSENDRIINTEHDDMNLNGHTGNVTGNMDRNDMCDSNMNCDIDDINNINDDNNIRNNDKNDDNYEINQNNNNDNNNNLPCHLENMIVEDTRSGVTSVDSNDDQEEYNDEKKVMNNIEIKTKTTELSNCGNDNENFNAIENKNQTENIVTEQNIHKSKSETAIVDNELEVEVEFIKTQEKCNNLDFQKRIFAMKKNEKGKFSSTRNGYFSITVHKHVDELVLPKIENTVFETFQNENSASVQDVKDCLLHELSLLNIKTFCNTSMSLSRSMIILSMILPLESNNNNINNKTEEFKLSVDSTSTWQIARLLREKGLNLAIYYRLDTTT